MTHLSNEDAARWVAGLLDDEDAARLEAHASTCRPCEALIQHEAAIQQGLVDALLATVVPLRRSPTHLRTWFIASLAASALLIAGRWALLRLRDVAPPADDSHFANERPPPEALVARAPFAL